MKASKLINISILIILLSSCVTSKKFKDLETLYNECSKNRDSLAIANQTLQATLADANIRINNLEAEKSKLIADTTSMGSELRYLRGKNAELADLNKTLEENYTKVLKGSEKEMTDLIAELNDAKLKLNERERELAEKIQRLKDVEAALA